MTRNISLTPAIEGDIRSLLILQAKAFSAHAAMFDVGLWAGETPEDLRTDLAEMTVLVARSEKGEIVGSVRAREVEGVWLIRKLSVDPDQQKAGIGSLLMSGIEKRCPEKCHKISVCTMLVLGENVRFFLNAGYLPDFLMPDHYNRLHLICFHKKPGDPLEAPSGL